MSDILQSGESRLQDVLYDYQALRQMAGQEPEAVVIDEELIGRASVFTDLNTGNRIAIGELPDNQAEFTGAMLSISGLGNALEIEGLPKDCREAAFAVTSLGRVFARDLTHKYTWQEFPASSLVHALDIPQAKPIAVSEQDPRNVPPILPGEVPEVGYPSILYEYYQRIIDADILPIPHDKLYTEICSLFDAEVRDKSHIPLHTKITRDGMFESPFKKQLFSLEAWETMAPDSCGSDFERSFFVRFHSLNGNTVFPGFKLGVEETEENIALRGSENFEFKITRGGMIIYDQEDGRVVLRAPHPVSVNILYKALSIGQDFQA